MPNDRIVILGNGGAAIFAAQTARKEGYCGDIQMVSDVDAPAFNPMLSPYYYKGRIPWEGCFPFNPSFYSDYEITCHFGSPVDVLDAKKQQVVLKDGLILDYDRCLIATGASPVIPPVPGLRESSRVFPLRSAASARKLEKAMRTAKKAVVLGASLVGMEMAEILHRRGIRVILLDVVEQILPRGTHRTVADILKAYAEEQGVDVRLDCTMEGMEGARDGVVCHFTGDIVEDADIVIVATGVRPNLDFIDREEVEVKQGLIVDDRMRSGVENLFAAGDVCQALNHVTGNYDWLGTWGSACYQGRVAGRNMVGKAAVFAGTLPENISPFFKWTFAQIGDIRPEGGEPRHFSFGDPRKEGFCMLAFQDDLLTGANLINCTNLAGRLRNAILRKWRCEKVVANGGRSFGEADIESIVNGSIRGLFNRSF